MEGKDHRGEGDKEKKCWNGESTFMGKGEGGPISTVQGGACWKRRGGGGCNLRSVGGQSSAVEVGDIVLEMGPEPAEGESAMDGKSRDMEQVVGREGIRWGAVGGRRVGGWKMRGSVQSKGSFLQDLSLPKLISLALGWRGRNQAVLLGTRRLFS